jgi:hypothetical protein
MSIQEVTSFKTSDGKTFVSIEEAEQHEAMLSTLPLVIQFAEAKSDSPRAHTRTVNMLTEWEQYKASGGTMEVAKAETPKKKEAPVAEAPVAEVAEVAEAA